MLLSELAKEFIWNCKCRRLSEKTSDNYEKQVGYLIQFLQNEYDISELEYVKPNHIKSFIMRMEGKGRKPSYLNDLLKAFKCLFKYAYEEGYTTFLLTEKVKNVKEPKVIIQTFTNAEVKRMIEFYKSTDYLSLRNKTILCTLFDTGIRANELMGLTKEQIKGDYLLIKGKGEKDRVVPKTPFLSKWLYKYMIVRDSFFEYKSVPDYVFLSRTGKRLTDEALVKFIRNVAEQVEVSETVRCSPHTCRHTFAQMQLRNGLDLYSLSRLMGHYNISITQRYLEGLKDAEVLNAGAKTSPLMNL